MTDTGRLPEGQPENAGGPQASVVPDPQPGPQAPAEYGFADTGEAVGEDDDLLFLPGSQGAWSEQPAAQTAQPRRPLHMGPPVPAQSAGVVRSLADRGPATPPTPMPSPFAATDSGFTPVAGAFEGVAPAAAGGVEGVAQPVVAAQPVPVGAQAPVTPQPAPVMPVADAVAQPVDNPAQMQTAPGEPVAAPVLPVEPVMATPAQPVLSAPAQTVNGVAAVAAHPVAVPVPQEAQTPAVADVMAAPPVDAMAAAEPTPPPAMAQPQSQPVPVRVPGPPTTGPEYLDVTVADLPGPQLGQIPPQPASWSGVPAPAPEPMPEAVPGQEPAPVAHMALADALVAPVPAPAGGAETVVQDEQDTTPAEPSADLSPEPAAEAPQPAAEPQAVDTPQPAAEPQPLDVPQPAEADTPAEAPQPATGENPAPATDAEPEAPAEEAQPATAESDQAPADPHPAPAEPAKAAPAAAFDTHAREAVHRVMRERRDIRNGFRPDPVPHEVLMRVLEAAHTAPSVGHSQPWDFLVIRSEDTRRKMHELAGRQREAYAASLPKGRAKQFKEMKVEAILDTPVNIVVTADPTRGGRHTLGRHTQPQMAPYSSALAVENLWLAARAEGLGVGWVSFFDERELCRELELPEHLDIVAYLCVGYVDEFPEEPELVQAGWSKRRPLSWVVHEETYGRRALPGEDPHDLLMETLDLIRPLDAKALGEAWERQKRMTKPAGSLGMLEIISAQLCGLSRKCPPPVPEPAAVAIFAGDHGVHAQGVTPWPQEVTAQMVANFLGGGAVCNAFAAQVGAEVCVVDVGVAAELPATPGLVPRKVRAGTADFSTGAAMTREETLKAIEVGIETARDLVTAGNRALLTGEMGIANTTASAALISVYTDSDPAEVTGRGTGINDETHARKVDVVRHALDLHKPDASDPVGVLAAVGGLEHAALVGFILGGASMRTPVILDGVSAGAAALVARAIAPEALAACVAGHRSAEPGHSAALTKLGLRPLIDLDLRLGEGTGALLALPVVQSAARAMHEVATFDAAGVTEKG
ncbi:nicotinate-nucleotide--dimethylbenzimidazole phosphoribosyltransferase [Streptomyces sp. NPDC051940]|uniref:nicotinate-nucleotide--dimethylbenzimidazole phosphoribosyltransferase n=1 Tax=Streptomyces sp. NPDC051940 TaxID=3155675 RepID=UPI00342A2DFF